MKKNGEIKVCLVGSSGGHLTHLYMLKPFWKDKNRFWVTFDKEDARSLLEGEKVYSCYFPTNRSIKALIKNTKIAWDVLHKEKPDLIISCGAAVAVPFFYIGKMVGAKLVYIEVFDRIDKPTMTGKMVYQTLYQILSMILPLITSPILSRALGANGLGVYSYTTTILNYFVLIANLGIYRYGIRCIASAGDDKIERSKVFWEIFLSHILISVVIFGLYILFVVNFQGEYLQYYIVLTLMYLGGTLNINWFFFGIEEYKGVAIRDMVIKIATFVLIVLCVNNEHDLYTYFIIMAASSFISNATYYVMIRGKISRPQVCWCNMWTHLKHMLILFVPTLLETMYISIDKAGLFSDL